jgi:hypothetical protein
MSQMDYEQEIRALEAGIARLQGQIDLLRMLQQAGAVVQLPAKEDAPPADAPNTP